MTTWYITTGISTTKDSRCWTLFHDRRQQTLADHDHEPIGTLREDERLWPFLASIDQARGELLRPASRDPGDLKKWAAQLARGKLREECWTDPTRRHALPAELATLSVLSNRGLITADDTLILILGESNIVDGYILEAILEHLARAHGPLAGVTIETVGPFALDPRESGVFNTNFRNLVAALRVSTDTRFVLTGGYKALLMAITHWLAITHPAVPVYSLHESGAEVIEIKGGAGGGARANAAPAIPDIDTVV